MSEAIKATAGAPVAFGDVVQLSKERSKDPEADGFERYIGLDHLEPGDLEVRSWGRVADGTTFTNVFRPGQVLFGKRRAYQRKVAVADFSGVCSGDIYVLESKCDHLLPELLPFICQSESFYDYVISMSQGGLSPRVNWKALAKYEFALPPMGEQRRIVAVLQAAENVIVAQRRLRNRGWKVNIANYDDATSDADSRWEVAAIGDALQIENRLRKPLSSAVRSGIQGEFPYFGATGQLDSISEYRLEGTYALIGEDGDHFLKYAQQSMTQLISGRFNVNNHAHVIAGSDRCLTEWFYHYYRYRDVRPWLAKQGAGRLKLKKATLESMPISLPPVDEQRTTIARLESTANAVDAIERRIESCQMLQRQLLQALLGES